jgi:hypothetical protein
LYWDIETKGQLGLKWGEAGVRLPLGLRFKPMHAFRLGFDILTLWPLHARARPPSPNPLLGDGLVERRQEVVAWRSRFQAQTCRAGTPASLGIFKAGLGKRSSPLREGGVTSPPGSVTPLPTWDGTWEVNQVVSHQSLHAWICNHSCSLPGADSRSDSPLIL